MCKPHLNEFCFVKPSTVYQIALREMVVTEVYGQSSLKRGYVCEPGRVRTILYGGARNFWRSGVSKFIKEAFLPRGYPDSVSEDYLAYQFWDTMQAFCSSITGALATLAILKGVGVGDSEATPLAATLTWMLKDGTGMLGRILFGWMVATDLDCNSKFWRLVADILNDLGNFLELIAPLFPSLFLLIVCSASIAKAIVGIAGGATRAALVQHQARRDNMADVAAKDNSQETVVNLMALLVNLLLTPMVAGKTELVWTLFVVFTLLHLLSNYWAVSVVTMETLNKGRLHLLVSTYLNTGSVLSVRKINAREPILSPLGLNVRYKLGVSLSDAIASVGDYEKLEQDSFQGSLSILHFDPSTSSVRIALERRSDTSVQLKAAIAVEVVDYIVKNNWLAESPVLSTHYSEIKELKGNILETLHFAEKLVDKLYSDLTHELNKAGWVTSHVLLNVEEWRYSWEASKQG